MKNNQIALKYNPRFQKVLFKPESKTEKSLKGTSKSLQKYFVYFYDSQSVGGLSRVLPKITQTVLAKLKDKKRTDSLDWIQESAGYSAVKLDDRQIFKLQVALRKAMSKFTDVGDADVYLSIDVLSEDFRLTVLENLLKVIYCEQHIRPSGKKEKISFKEKQFHLVSSKVSSVQFSEIEERAKSFAATNGLARYLAELPANVLTSKSYPLLSADVVKKIKGVKSRFIGANRLKQMGAGAAYAVMKGSPRGAGGFFIAQRRGRRGATKVTLVGKGLCFDTGGYNIKTSHMYSMHKDMTGSAVALGAFQLLTQENPEIDFTLIMGIAENLISNEAFRPNDFVSALNGLTIEVVDTDAEGRMVLADCLAYASMQKPDLIIDFATLTGAATRAIGTARSAAFSNNEQLFEKILEAGRLSGERVWAFPLGDDYKDLLKSDVADILQCSALPGPDHILAATFLNEFVPKDIDWVHVDLSSDSHSGGLGLISTEVTGFGVHWVQKFLELYLSQ